MCQPGDTTGFPVKLAQSIFSNWPSTNNSQAQLQKLTVPTDFTVQWGPPTNSAPVAVRQKLAADGAPGVFQISGISTVTDATSLTYGNARYNCSGIISIVQNQHPTFCQSSNALYEAILAFQITSGSKSSNPSSPDVILLCRPIVFATWADNPFWSAVDRAVTRSPQTAPLDLSSLYGYNSSMLMPMITYQTCLPVKLINYNGQPFQTGSIRVRVNVVPQPLYINGSENGLGKCSSIRKYTLVTVGAGPVNVFRDAASNTLLQFQDGYGSDLFPSQQSRENLTPNAAPSTISAFSDIIQKFEIQVPEVFLGKSLAEIANADKPPKRKPKKKAFKCYTIDPTKDVVGDQIMIDPTTGESLRDTMKEDGIDSAGADIEITQYYTMTGDDITIPLRVIKTFPLSGPNPSGISDLTCFIAQDGPRVKLVFASLSDTTKIIDNSSYIGDASVLTSINDVFTMLRGMKPSNEFKKESVDTIQINTISINGIDNSSSGIMPGDIEYIFTVIATVCGTICLAAYLFFILHKIFFRNWHDAISHIVTFVVLFICLILFGIYVEKPAEESRS